MDIKAQSLIPEIIVTSPTTNKEPLKKDSPEVEEPKKKNNFFRSTYDCLLYTSPSPRDNR